MAEKNQGAILRVSSAEAAADNITGATAADPVELTSASHGIANGTIVRVTGVGGMDQLNNRAFVAAAVATNTLQLKGVDGTDYTAYTSGGQAFAQTMLEISECDLIGPGFNGQSPKIPTAHLRSTGQEFLLGIPDYGDMPVGFFDRVSDAGQKRLRKLHETGAVVPWSITLASGRVAAFMGCVMQCGFEPIAQDTAFKGSAVICITSRPAHFA
jgi:hypothetical protein